jgi:hypothetical protein
MYGDEELKWLSYCPHKTVLDFEEAAAQRTEQKKIDKNAREIAMVINF